MFKISPFSTPRKTQQLQVPSFSVPACIPARRVLFPSASRTDPQGTASCPWPFSSPLSSRLRRSRPRLKAAPPQSSAPFSEKMGKEANVPTAFLPLVFSSALYSASRRSSSARSASCFPPFFVSFPALFFIQSQTKTAMMIPTMRPTAMPIAR
uniref:Transmembrane protein n=1 Tax=Meloidogyne incognita TaxID=6306 RepID=A0A914MAE1_MELIC